MSSAPVATRYTLEFVRQHVRGGSLLEIGCGAGELAACLANDGFDVAALDSDPDCVSLAQARGVDARALSWPAPIDQKFEAVLFTRSLHHIDPPDEAIEVAVDALRPGGKIIVEDFRFELDSRRTRTWFTGLMRLFDTARAFDSTGALPALLDKLDFGEHRHELHSSTAIAAVLGRHGTIHQQDAAYYFRYAEPEIDKPLAEQMLEHELEMIEAGAIDPLGKRFVLTPARES